MPINTSANQCIRCGRCMKVCPVYQTTFKEADVARGRLVVLETMAEGALRRSARLPEILSRCLMCGACAHACVNEVDTTGTFQQGRESYLGSMKGRKDNPLLEIIRQGGIPGDIVAKGGALLESLFCKKIPEGSGLHLRFPLSFFMNRTAMPPIAWTPFLKGPLPKGNALQGKKVALFVGCGANYLFPEAAKALLRILEAAGVAVDIPTDQGCCGLPAYVSGDTHKARALARKNLEAFGRLEVDAVLTVCASCGAHLERMGRLFEGDPILNRSARVWSEKHSDAMRYLVEELSLNAQLEGLSEGSRKIGSALRVAYHDPCHLRLAQGGTDAPRILLKSLPGVRLENTSSEVGCCGHGGDFNLSHYDVSMRILKRRMDELQKADPHAIVTGCTGCLLQLLEGVGRHGLKGKVRVCHPLVLVEQVIAGCR